MDDALRRLANKLTGRQIEAMFAVRRGELADPELLTVGATRLTSMIGGRQALTLVGEAALDVVDLLGRFVSGLGIVKRTSAFLYTSSTTQDKLDFAIVARRGDDGQWRAYACIEALRAAFPALRWIG